MPENKEPIRKFIYSGSPIGKEQALDDLLTQALPGVLDFAGSRMALVDIESGLWSLRRQAEALAGSVMAAEGFRRAGSEAGNAFARRYVYPPREGKQAEAMRACVAAYQTAGFGRFLIEALEWPPGEIRLEAEDTFESAMFLHHPDREITRPVCAYTSGVLTGFVHALSGQPSLAFVETACQARGDRVCRFELRSTPDDDLTGIDLGDTDDLQARLVERNRALATLLEVVQAASSTLNVDRMLGKVATGLAQALGVRRCGIYLVDEDSGALLPAGGTRSDGPEDPLTRNFRALTLHPDRDDFVRDLIETQRPVFCANAEQDPRVGKEIVQLLGLKSILGVPFVVRDRVVAVAMISTHNRFYHFSPEQVDLAAGVANTVALIIENARLYQAEQEQRRQAERRRAVAEELRDILAVLNSNRTFKEILEYIVLQARWLLGAHAAVIYRGIINEDAIRVEAASGAPVELVRLGRLPSLPEAANLAILRRKPYAISELEEDVTTDLPVGVEGLHPKLVRWKEIVRKHYRAYLIIPLVIKDEVYGALALYYPKPRDFTDEDINLGMTLGDHVALAIENARLREQVERSAVAAERNRLARELHDAVTQTLFSASLIAEVLPRLWERNPEQAQLRLDELRELTRGALAEMRTLLLELRPSAVIEADVDELFRHLADAFTGRARMPVDLVLDGDCSLEPEIKVALYRIAQEALNNIVKHSQATQTSLHVHCHPGQVLMEITDNGVGFDPEVSSPDHLGLGIMRERAEQVGASLDLISSFGGGTVVRVILQHAN